MKDPTFQYIPTPRPQVSTHYSVNGVPQEILDRLGLDDATAYLGSPGQYKVTAMLAIPGKQVFFDQIHLNAFVESGESLLKLAGGTPYKLNLNSPMGPLEIRFIPNEQEKLARVEIKLNAQDMAHAQAEGHDILMSIMSWMSYRFDVGIEVAGWQIFEETSKASRFIFVALAREQAIDGTFQILVK